MATESTAKMPASNAHIQALKDMAKKIFPDDTVAQERHVAAQLDDFDLDSIQRTSREVV